MFRERIEHYLTIGWSRKIYIKRHFCSVFARCDQRYRPDFRVAGGEVMEDPIVCDQSDIELLCPADLATFFGERHKKYLVAWEFFKNRSSKTF